MTIKEKTEFIRQKCIAANPEAYVFGVPRPIRLADVLVPIVGDLDELGSKEQFDPIAVSIVRTVGHWNLRADDLEKQSEETISFIYKILQ